MTSAFRHHTQPPARVASPLYRQLIDEWVQLNQLKSSQLALRQWGRLEPALTGHRSPADLVDAIDQATSVAEDAMLVALIRLAQSGRQLAGRILLQLMLPKLGRITNRTAGTSSDATWSEDRRHIAVAEFWDVINTYPVRRRTQKVAANLALETLRRITGPRTHRADIPVDPEILGRSTSHLRGGGLQVVDEPRVPGELTVDADLGEVVRWGVARRVISIEDGSLLRQVYQAVPGRSAADRVAAELGCSSATIRQRCSRARRHLVTAVREEIIGANDDAFASVA